MEENCFYCEHELKESYSYGQFVMQNDHIEKPLCQECYQDWLEGMKE